MSQPVTRHFATIDGRFGPRQVHYRRAGAGPVVLLLHQSPQSSREMTDLMQRWALHFTTIAPDTPGYGQSDPLGHAHASIADFADALLEFANALGLRRFGVYGYHTGSSIGLWLAARHPERVTALAANGLAQFTDDERRVILEKYLPPLEPRWDGAHLAWLWARIREQTVFFPWHERGATSRLDLDMPAPERLQASVLEFLRATDHYAVAYRAAFESRPETLLADLKTPLLVTASPSDPLRTHFERYPPLPADALVQGAASAADAPQLALQHLLGHRGDDCPAPVATRPIPGRLWSSMVDTGTAQLHVRTELSGREEPLVLLHPAGESAATLERLATPLLGSRPLLLVDFPGHGESDPSTRLPGPTVSDCAESVATVLHRFGLNEARLVGVAAGACVAMDIARQGTQSGRRLALIDLPIVTAEVRSRWLDQGLPSLAPQWHGGHLLLAWHLVRDGRLFFPWFERSRRGARHGTPDLDDRRLLLETGELLKASGSWQALMRDALSYPTGGNLTRLEHLVVGASADSPWYGASQAAATASGRPFIELAHAPAHWLPALLGVSGAR